MNDEEKKIIAAYRAANRQKLRDRQAAYHAANRKKIAAQTAAYRAQGPR